MPLHDSPVRKTDLLAGLPVEWSDDGLAEGIREDIRRSGRRIVVLDDDPTGTQTVHDVNILTEWGVGRLREEFEGTRAVFFILTNSRSLPGDRARAMNIEIATNLARAARESGREFDLISRGDSTLRGHYPVETDALAETLERETGVKFDGVILLPFFAEGGRFTVHDTHWVQEGEMLTPAGRTEFARDPSFGYSSSDLRHWVAEKTAGRHAADEVISVSLEAIRNGGPGEVARILGGAQGGGPVIVNCVSERDLRVVVTGLLRSEAAGKRFLFRTAASFVKARGGFADRKLLGATELNSDGGVGRGGLVVVGSYIRKSSEQLEAARLLPNVAAIELNSARILDPATREREIGLAAEAAGVAITGGKTGLVFTSRGLIKGATGEESLQISRSVSDALVGVVRRIGVTPRFIVAKGGITSSDTATRGLGVRRARVLGAIAPGVPVWRLGDESRFPGVPYVVFPGNVGSSDTLARVIGILQK